MKIVKVVYYSDKLRQIDAARRLIENHLVIYSEIYEMTAIQIILNIHLTVKKGSK